MSEEKFIKITKKDGTFHIVPASQKAIYEGFNAKNEKLKKKNDVVTIEDYIPPVDAPKTAKDASAPAPKTAKDASAPAPKTAKDVIAAIGDAASVEEVDALIEGDTRASVIAAADAKKATFTK